MFIICDLYILFGTYPTQAENIKMYFSEMSDLIPKINKYQVNVIKNFAPDTQPPKPIIITHWGT